MSQSLWEHKYEEEAATKLFYLKLREIMKNAQEGANIKQEIVDLNKLYEASRLAVHNDYLYIRTVTIVLSKQCTLKCRDCCSLIPYFKGKPMNFDEVYTWFLKLMESVDYVESLALIGGEPLLQKRLPELIKIILENKKIGKVQLVTNGTLFPSAELIDVISNNKRVEVYFSSYDLKITPQYNEILDFCRKHQVNIKLHNYSYWTDWFKLSDKNNYTELEYIFNLCSTAYCKEIWNGRLYFCTIADGLDNLDLLKSKEGEFVDLLNTDPAERRKQISNLMRRSKFVSCLGCSKMHDSPQVPVAVQIKKPDLEKLRIQYKKQLAVLGIS